LNSPSISTTLIKILNIVNFNLYKRRTIIQQTQSRVVIIQCHSQGCPWVSSNIYITINFFKVVFTRLVILETMWLNTKSEKYIYHSILHSEANYYLKLVPLTIYNINVYFIQYIFGLENTVSKFILYFKINCLVKKSLIVLIKMSNNVGTLSKCFVFRHYFHS